MNKEIRYTKSDTSTTNKLNQRGLSKVTFIISTDELNYYNSVLGILYNLRLNGKPVLNPEDMSLGTLSKLALDTLINNYKNNVLADDRVIDNIPVEDEKTFEDLLSFRAKYMNIPIDQQIASLKKKGVLG